MKTILTVAMLTAMAPSLMAQQKIIYPKAPQSATVDTYFGHQVQDPYRPLENDTSAQTKAWVIAENQVTNDYLSQIPYRNQLKQRLTELNNFKKHGRPYRENDGRLYFSENDGLKNQSVIYRYTNGLGSEVQEFLDPNKLSDDGTVALKGIFQSKDGKYSAYTISRSGSDWTEIYVMDTETGMLLPDHIEWAKFTDPAWDGDGFYYSAYPVPEKGKEFSNANENHLVLYHKLGTPQTEDKIVFEDKANPLHFHAAQMAESEPVLFVFVSGQGFGNGVLVRDLKNNPNGWKVMEPSQDYEIGIIDVIDGQIYFQTSYGAAKNQVMRAPVANPSKENWVTVIPEQEGVIMSTGLSGDQFVVVSEKDATGHITLFDLNGKNLGEVQLPGLGSVGTSTSRKHPGEIFYTYTSFNSPSAAFLYNGNIGKSQLLYRPEIAGVNLDDYVTEQVFYPSTDGTKIPMFITYKKGLKRDGKNPVYLYGYGGFNNSLPPSFSANRMLWLENGGIYAQANLRGGAEYGEPWHVAGTKMNKLNVFNDFISAAEYMINQGWTSPEHLVIEGASNGGLLVGATVNMRPDLFKAALPRVGVMDMMRYHLFTIGWNWAPDYGTSADSPEMAEYLLAYSPVHNIKNDGTPYPAILVTTADHDDRVVPAHSFKYAAALQAANTGDAPKLIRIDSKAGHGGGKPISKVIDEWTDLYSFLFNNLGITPKN